MVTKDQVDLARDIFVGEFMSNNIVGTALGHPLGQPDEWKLVVLLLEWDQDLPDFIEMVPVVYTKFELPTLNYDGEDEDDRDYS